jgi:hypothetical protein
MTARTSTQIQLNDLTNEDRKSKLWKNIGYRGQCKFVASDDDFFTLWRFSELSSRILLGLQDELCKLEVGLRRKRTT